jgi:Secretion system C-terminal sorting domain
MVGFPFIESIQAFSARTSITSCRIQTAGPWGWAGVRVYKGAAISRNWFIGNFEATPVEARQGAVLVSWNVISALRSFALLNEGAPLPALLRFRNNTVFGGEFLVETGPGSTVEIVNNIFHEHGQIFCSAEWDIRYNDFYNTAVICQLDEGNIDASPLYCDPDALTLDPQSPCVGSGEHGGNMGAMGVCQLTAVNDEAPLATEVVLSVHPNPVRTVAEFKLSGIAVDRQVIEIYNSNGRLVDALRLDAESSVQWTPPLNLPRGVYFVRTGSGQVSKILKFVVIH